MFCCCIYTTKGSVVVKEAEDNMTRGSVCEGEEVHSWGLDVFLLSVLGIRQVDREYPFMGNAATFATQECFSRHSV